MRRTNSTTMTRYYSAALAVTLTLGWLVNAAPLARAAGTLKPKGSPGEPIQILDHHVNVVINNGFARTEVLQRFYNPNPADLEAIYSFPIPQSASLSEVTIYSGEQEIHGEVLPRKKAEQIYEEEKSKGNDAGLARKNGYQTFEFLVSPVRAHAETGLRFVYYQPLEIDTGVGRYVYPLEDGATDEAGASFWISNETVARTFSADIELKSAYPVTDVRVPGFEPAMQATRLDDGHHKVHIETQGATLNRDLVFYYRLAADLPGRVELIAYRADADKPGTFMLVVTPGLDLAPLAGGADYTFVLDVSGSMKGKIQTLARGVAKAIGELRAEDRFRIVTFNNRAAELTRGWVTATPDNVQEAVRQVVALSAGGGTNLYDGLTLALRDLDDDRATSVILVTDAVTNTGVVEPQAFHELMKRYDVRLFGFLLGNNANWPLMRMVCETSGGFWTHVSNADDILGQIMLAKSKVTHECLHDATLQIRGANVFETTGTALGKVYRGQQLVLFGRYDGSGAATIELSARLTGQDKTYTTSFAFPAKDTENPEIERLWAMSRIEAIEAEQLRGAVAPTEAEQAVEDLGVAYQLVTDQTAMLVLADAVFDDHGIERRNAKRIASEHAAQRQRSAQPVRSHRVDGAKPMFDRAAPSVGRKGKGGGGALDPISVGIMAAVGGLALAGTRRRNRTTDLREGQ